jgi:hypothetical protein
MLDDNGNGTAAANGFDDSYNMPHEGFWRIPARSFWASPSQDTLFNQLSVLRTNQRNFLTKGKETAPDENDPKKFDYYDFVGLGWVQTAQTLTVKAMAESTNSDLLPAKAKGLLDEKGWVERNIPQADLDKLNFYSVDYPEVANTVDFAVRQNHGRNQ